MTRVGRAVVFFLLTFNGGGMFWLGAVMQDVLGSGVLPYILGLILMAIFFYLLWDKDVKL